MGKSCGANLFGHGEDKMLNLMKFRIIDLYTKTDVVNIYKKCLEEEWLPLYKLKLLQFLKLKELLIHAYQNTKYYKRLFDEFGFNPKKMENFNDIKIIPIQTKQDIRKNFEDIKSFDFSTYRPSKNRTSGSTGEPFEIYLSGLSHSYLRALNYAAWHQAGYNLGDKFAAFAGGSLLPGSIGFMQHAYTFLQNSTPLPSYHLNKDYFLSYLNKLQTKKIKYIYGYASALYDFAKTIKDKNLEFSFVKGLFSSSDMLYPAQRKLIEEVIGIKIIDIYGNPESGLISYECNMHSGYHYGMLNSYVEITDEEGSNLAENLQGKVIVTSLNSHCFPLIRYDNGDIAALSNEKCKCGRGLQKLKNLGGRSRDFIILKNGRHIHGAFFNHLNSIYKANWLYRYHVIQKDYDELIFQCMVNREPTIKELNEIKKEISLGTNNLVKIETQIVDVIPMTKMGKYKLISREFESSSGTNS